jgi:hypothetical protein
MNWQPVYIRPVSFASRGRQRLRDVAAVGPAVPLAAIDAGLPAALGVRCGRLRGDGPLRCAKMRRRQDFGNFVAERPLPMKSPLHSTA